MLHAFLFKQCITYSKKSLLHITKTLIEWKKSLLLNLANYRAKKKRDIFWLWHLKYFWWVCYTCVRIKQKGMTFDQDFGYSLPLFSSLLKKREGGKEERRLHGKNRGQKSCLSVRSYVRIRNKFAVNFHSLCGVVEELK